MNANESALEVRDVKAIEIPQCEVVLPMPLAWFDAINTGRGIHPGLEIAAIVSEGHGFITGPRVSRDFYRIWVETLKPYRRKIPRRGEMVRALVPMRREVFECLQTAAESVGSYAHEVALAILARVLEIERKFASPDYPAAPLPERMKESEAAGNPLIFHKCRHCPHALKPWDSPRNAS